MVDIIPQTLCAATSIVTRCRCSDYALSERSLAVTSHNVTFTSPCNDSNAIFTDSRVFSMMLLHLWFCFLEHCVRSHGAGCRQPIRRFFCRGGKTWRFGRFFEWPCRSVFLPKWEVRVENKMYDMVVKDVKGDAYPVSCPAAEVALLNPSIHL